MALSVSAKPMSRILSASSSTAVEEDACHVIESNGMKMRPAHIYSTVEKFGVRMRGIDRK